MPTEEITIEDLVNWYCEEHNITLWKDIPGYEGWYQVSNTGQIRSLDRLVYSPLAHSGSYLVKGKILKQTLNKDGYPQVCLIQNGVRSTNALVHIFVAKAWVPNPLSYTQVNHIDECKTSNNAGNLEWCDCKYNIRWGTGIKRRAELKKKPVNQFTLDGVFLATHNSAKDVEKALGISGTHITACCKGNRKSAGGYVWKYA